MSSKKPVIKFQTIVCPVHFASGQKVFLVYCAEYSSYLACVIHGGVVKYVDFISGINVTKDVTKMVEKGGATPFTTSSLRSEFVECWTSFTP